MKHGSIPGTLEPNPIQLCIFYSILFYSLYIYMCVLQPLRSLLPLTFNSPQFHISQTSRKSVRNWKYSLLCTILQFFALYFCLSSVEKLAYIIHSIQFSTLNNEGPCVTLKSAFYSRSGIGRNILCMIDTYGRVPSR